MNINEYRFACAVASSGSFTAAANACFVTQPTLSNGIARLEHEFGERIFVRTTRNVTLTPFGVYILPYLTEVVRAHEMLKQQARAFGTPEPRVIRIGVSPVINAHLLGSMIAPFRLEHPEVEIVLREMSLANLERRLAEGVLDFIFEVGKTTKRSWQSVPVYREPLCFVPRGGVLPERMVAGSVRLADIADETYMLTPGDACGLARATRELFRSNRCKLNEYPGDTLSCQVLEEWAALGIGAAILPRSKLSAPNSQAFPIVDKSGADAQIVITATWPRKGTPAPCLSEFVAHLQAAGRPAKPSSSAPPSGGERARPPRTRPQLQKLCDA
jgi:DNA-binding transcriptional LysR family regulator